MANYLKILDMSLSILQSVGSKQYLRHYYGAYPMSFRYVLPKSRIYYLSYNGRRKGAYF